MNEHGCVPIKLNLWAMKFEISIVFMCHEYFSLKNFPQTLKKNVKTILNSQGLQKEVMRYIWPMGQSVPIPKVDDEVLVYIYTPFLLK